MSLRRLIEEWRLYLAELMLGWALAIAPRGRPESEWLARAALDYAQKVRTTFRRR